jgi:hypothetical protein
VRILLQKLVSFLENFSDYVGYFQVKWITCHHHMALPQAAGRGNDQHMWMVIANILNKQSWIKGGPPAWLGVDPITRHENATF